MEKQNKTSPTSELASAAFATIGWIELFVSVVAFILELYIVAFFFAIGSMVMATVIRMVRNHKRAYDAEQGFPPAAGPTPEVLARNKRVRLGMQILGGLVVVLAIVFAGGDYLRSTAPIFDDGLLKALAFIGWSLALVVQSNRLQVEAPAPAIG